MKINIIVNRVAESGLACLTYNMSKLSLRKLFKILGLFETLK